jgi:hypothetical protein
MVEDLRGLLRRAQGKSAQPSVAVIDGRTVQSTPGTGRRAGYDGHKQERLEDAHGGRHPRASPGAARDRSHEQERGQVAALAQDVQEITGATVELAYVDQGYTGEEAARAAAEHGINSRW